MNTKWFRYCAWCKGFTFRFLCAEGTHTHCIACAGRNTVSYCNGDRA